MSGFGRFTVFNMPNFGKKYAQRKGPENVQSPSVNGTGRATEKSQEAKQRSQSIVQKLRNSDNKNNSEPLEEDAEYHVGSPTNLSSAFDTATPTKLDQREEGERSDTPEPDARAPSPAPTHGRFSRP